MEAISFSATMSLDWAPLPWDVGPVVPLIDDKGRVLVYAETSGQPHRKTGLPAKLVESPIELDTDDPRKLTGFMSKYGLIGVPPARDLRAQAVMSVKTKEDAIATDNKYHFQRGENPDRSDGSWSADDRLAWYKTIQLAVVENDLGWKPSWESFNDFTLGTMFVTPTETRSSLERLVEAHRVVLALMKTSDPVELASVLDREQNEIWDHVVYHIDELNSLLTGIHPSITIEYPFGNEHMGYPLSEDYMRDEPTGTFNQAYALSVYKQALGKSGAKRCKECGKVFTKRKSKTRKTSSRSTAQFCSDRCKNRYNQRERRQRLKNTQ